MKQQVMLQQLIKLVKHEVLPALGCTEPISLALAAACAARHIDKNSIEKIDAFVSPNLMKNGMGVTVPGTGMIGLPIAAAIGAIGGDADAGLEVLKNITDNQITQAKNMLADNKITVQIAKSNKAIYSEANIYTHSDHVKVCIEDQHTNVTLIEKNGETIFQADNTRRCESKNDIILKNMSVRLIYEFASQANFDDIKFILDSAKLNDALSQEGLSKAYGLSIATTLHQQTKTGLLADDLLSKVIIRTTAASDARMGGATLPAMSNSGSGNQGITATMPVVVVADYSNATPEQLARALMLSHTIAIYIHSKFPPLSALCAASTAAMGSAAGMAWLLGKGQYEPVDMTICNMIGDLSGIICDGASNSCAMKVSTSVSSGFKAVLMALNQTRVTGKEGIVCDSVETSINNLGAIVSNSMKVIDSQIIDIMSHKA
ncbi:MULTISPECIES: serine dehydratase subunit alpha family protein [unclassified Gilliamella]|uniref:L-cysteine desulfidase family protein n=1 Tax=unclassified Gilliamella TaxID=2685620 RepID=UPI00226AAB29|nr:MULTISPECIES: L-serine ammonia-lyase, iron-sulfur-dependent, subunit alpha [unclassified Gilliamella]MCX8601685.1 serine dehydratase subunit alpha family protein [Gilliamella sp. B3722]MCX8607883.1 serine dehydratase subunit alpha family protein [Gilliamella sp. B3771]MCX8610948.1 serine dehydratase subunit alpha family protein [Gilliamella sp. B3891]MCX8613416.1 serine dehydratase subunit alpha family protein [Gilliamella sp. B3773]MCX8615259.1 serine dehydratase subunit alpha family prote